MFGTTATKNRLPDRWNCLSGSRTCKKKRAAEKAARRGRKCRRGGTGYSNFSVITGNVSLALASDLTTVASAFSAVGVEDGANPLVCRHFGRSSIFFSREERGCLRLSATRLAM